MHTGIRRQEVGHKVIFLSSKTAATYLQKRKIGDMSSEEEINFHLSSLVRKEKNELRLLQ